MGDLFRAVRGQALVEFALALPLLLLLLMGLFDMGRAVYTYNTIANAARVGNRVAIVDQSAAAVRTAAKQEAVWVGLVDSDINVAFDCTNEVGCLARVAVAVTYDPAMPLIGLVVGPIRMNASSEMPIERVYQSP